VARGAWITLENGMKAHVYGDFPQPRQCCNCHRVSTRLCDWKLGGGRTCDKPMCPSEACGISPAPDKDLCPGHAKLWANKKPGRNPPANDLQKKLL